MKESLAKEIARAIFGDDAAVPLPKISPLAGGDINRAARLDFGTESYFVKWNDAKKFPNMFAREAEGLQLLHNANAVRIPQIVAQGSTKTDAFLVLEFVESGRKGKEFWQKFGAQLAQLHRTTSAQFGAEKNNYIGSLPQCNSPKNSWAEFYAECRLEPQLRRATDAGFRLPLGKFEKLFHQLEKLVPEEKPALVHGDLWGGNYLVDEAGNPVLIDPAAYFGHREMDFGMMHLFGGFRPELFEAYHIEFPIENGWQERLPLHQLYPLLVHVNLFGESYVGQVKSALAQFV